MAEEDQNQEIGALNREKNAIRPTHPVSQIPGYATGLSPPEVKKADGADSSDRVYKRHQKFDIGSLYLSFRPTPKFKT